MTYNYLLVLVVLLSFHYCWGITNPGFKAAITTKGFNYLNDVGVPILKKELGSISIPDVSGKADIKIGKIKYTLKNIHLTDLQIGSSSLTSSTGVGLTFLAKDISVRVSGDWSYKSWIARDHGSVDASGSGISLTVSILAGADEKGRPNVTTTGCSFNAGHLSVKIHGGASWLYNLFDGVFENSIKKALNSKICDLASKSINTAANKALGSLPVVIPIDKVSEISYALIRQPIFNSWFIESFHKGEFLSVTQPNTEAPFTPSPIPPLPQSLESHCNMVYLWVTDYVANTAALVYMRAGYLQYNVTPDMVGHLGPFFKLDTSTFSLLIPELFHKYPNKNMTLGIRTNNKPPMINITPQGVNFTIPGAIDFYILDGEYMPLAFTLGIMATVDAKVTLEDNSKNNQLIVKANATYLSAELSILASNFGKIDVSKIQSLFNLLSHSVIVPKINEFVNKGFPIPMVDDLKFINPTITLGKGYVMIATDINYTT